MQTEKLIIMQNIYAKCATQSIQKINNYANDGLINAQILNNQIKKCKCIKNVLQ